MNSYFKTYFQFILVAVLFFTISCKDNNSETLPVKDASISFTVNGSFNGTLTYKGLNLTPKIVITFSEAINVTEVNNIKLRIENGSNVNTTNTFSNQNKTN